MRESSSATAEYPVLGWSHLLLLAVAFICSRTTSAFPVRDNSPLFEFSDQVRLLHLYTSNDNVHMHLQITPEGVVSGSQDKNVYSDLLKEANGQILRWTLKVVHCSKRERTDVIFRALKAQAIQSNFIHIAESNGVTLLRAKNTIIGVLEMKAVKRGIIVIRGKKTALFLCMDHYGHLYGSETYKEEDCNFREDARKDGHFLYFSEMHGAPLALKPPRGAPLTQFLPMKNSIPLDGLHEDTNPYEITHKRTVDVQSDDPLKMRKFTNLGYVSE